ncbi:response regulator transcription factor [Candidatus Enterococcus clewellii]|uniref:Two-component system, response regulator YesN n=2 Tax=Candidatus Enterococcus clewellii TaxID=1834193 RepID=A0AAQ3XZW4_9ENTE
MYNFLLVDDEALIRKGTLKKIEKLDLPIRCAAEAANGKEAIALLETETIDFIITDMDMPEIDGIALLDHLKINFPLLPIIVISGYENFDYVKKALQANAINYILKPFSKEDILKALNEALAKLDSSVASKENEEEMILNTILGHKTQLAINALTAKIKPGKSYLLVLVSLSEKDALPTNAIKQLAIFVAPIKAEAQLFIAVIEQTNLPALLEQVADNGLLGISKEVIDFSEIHHYYLQCIDALNTRTATSSNAATFIDESFKTGTYTFEKTAEIMYLIEAGKAVDLQEKLTEYFQHLIESQNPSLYTLKQIGLSLIEKSKNLLDDFYHTKSNYTFPEVFKEVMEQHFIFPEVLSYFINFLSTIAKGMAYEKVYASNDIIENIQTYLKKHYKDPINLDLLADLFYINQSYLSSLFKERTGSKYIDYLNQLRIEEAKIMLSNTDRKSGLIAKSVGYENEKYFFRVFKKYTNTTPEQYRLEHKTKKKT